MKLLSPAQIGLIEVNNRVVMAPMTRSRSDNPDAAPTKIHEEYYAQRASAGLIITEGVIVSEQGRGYINVPGVYSQAQTGAWKKVADAVHAKGGKIFMQLWHVGRLSHPYFHGGEPPVAPSAINPNTKVFTPEGMTETVIPKELSKEEIAQIVIDFKHAGENALKAGFDGVEIHSSNGYLFHQFFANCSNTRTDEYGGSHENKSRFLFEVIEALSSIMPQERIGVRLNPMHNMMGIRVDEDSAPTFDYIINKLNNYSLAYLHLSKPFTPVEGAFVIDDVIGHYREIYKGFLIANTAYNAEVAEKDVSESRADAIAFGVPFIANPDLVERFENSWPLANPDKTTFYTPGAKGYTDYPKFK